eukprot:TRINITY_DN13022_c0_g1_i1.p2 TRINITY_DN13022_c0_g1~~TRINITY_DN13022_c0_g1_i1.p2  ORF type:complete len:137 (+),score=16.41 TRINITY_DN13022_c0_g1_i1:94-504(+)
MSRKDCEIQSYLQKRARSNTSQWDFRYFIIKNSKLVYFHDPRDNDEKGVVFELRGAWLKEDAESVTGRKLSFGVTPMGATPDTLYMQAKNPAEYQQWIAALRKACVVPDSAYVEDPYGAPRPVFFQPTPEYSGKRF